MADNAHDYVLDHMTSDIRGKLMEKTFQRISTNSEFLHQYSEAFQNNMAEITAINAKCLK